jgi:hypothetical protein
MKIRARISEGLAILATFAAVLAKDTIVAITANRTINKAGADAVAIGEVTIPAKAVSGTGTIETPFRALIEIKASGALVAGDRVKLAAADGVTGENRVTKWISQTDAAAGDKPDSLYGVVWNGGADGATVEVLVY